jgi:hypothetical protein
VKDFRPASELNTDVIMKHCLLAPGAGGSRALIWAPIWATTALFITQLHAASLTWTGAGANAFWSTPGNWSPAGPPANGDTLTFPDTASRKDNTNDLLNLRVQSVRFTGGPAT